MFTVSRAEDPDVTCGVAWTAPGAAQVCREVEAVYVRSSDSLTGEGLNAEPRVPDWLPWLATVVHPSVFTLWQMNVEWFVDFQQCMAVAMMDSVEE